MDSPLENSPLYLKAREIQRLVDTIVDVVYESELEFETEEEGKIIDDNINYLIENSILIPAHIAALFPDNIPYDQKMENATLIRKAAKDIVEDATTIETFGFKDIEYLDILRIEIDNFRILFAEWVKTFDPWDYKLDTWGLFNPPGVNYDDYNPNDDLPFGSSDDDDWDDEIDDDILGEGDEDD